MSHFFPAHDQVIMSLLSILQKNRERCYFFPINRHCKSSDSFKWQWVHLLKRSIWNAPSPVIPPSPWLWQALGKGHVLCSHSDKPCLSLLTRRKRVFDNGAPEGINMVPLFIDPRLDNLIIRCSLQALSSQYLFLPWFFWLFCSSSFQLSTSQTHSPWKGGRFWLGLWSAAFV